MKTFVFACVALACGTYAAIPSTRDDPQCLAPNGGGLVPVLKELADLIPKEDIAMIYLTAVSSDPEVQKVMAYLESEEFAKILKAIESAPEFTKLMNYACDELYLDAYYYYNKAAEILGLPPINRPLFAELATLLNNRPGLVGMIHDMIDVLPMDEIKALFKDKTENDEYAKKGMALLRSNDFKKMVHLIEKLPEFQQMLNELRGMGVEVDKIMDAVKKFFGW